MPTFLILAACLLAIPALAGFQAEKVAEGVYAALRTEPPGVMFDANVVFIVNEADVVVVDANLTRSSATKTMEALRAITNKPPRYLVITHWHIDHLGGAAAWKEKHPEIEIVAHVSAWQDIPKTGEVNRESFHKAAPGLAKRMRSLAAERKTFTGATMSDEEHAAYESDAALVESFAAEGGERFAFPSISVEDRMVLHREGGRSIEIRYLGAGHSPADLVVHLPKERVAITGDLLVWPVPLVGSTSLPSKYAATLRALQALGAATLVPGHGPVMKDDAHLRATAALLDSVSRQVADAVKRGETLEQARKAVDLAEFRRIFAGDSPQRAFIFRSYVEGPAVQAAYEEAKKQ
jgi:cyclase